MTRARILVGDCRARMAELPDASVDAVVTDPPYELGFMGKKWDASGIAHDVEVWRQALRVLKPGGHLLAFSGSRTYHRMTCAIEDAGFEVRDQIMWLYGSGFPKSHDVSKAIDKCGGASVAWFGPWFRKWREDNGVTQKQVAALFPSKTGGLTGCVANWELGFNMPTPDQFNAIRDMFGLPFASIEEAKREVVSKKDGSLLTFAPGQDNDRSAITLDITAPATDAARQWSGWGTALKPAHEPICLARKPLAGTVAANVLAYGTGALNVDGCRVPMELGDTWDVPNPSKGAPFGEKSRHESIRGTPDALGRWPANVIHDGSDDVTEGLREAARFFYTAKADRSDRDEVLGDIPRRVPPAVECQGDFDKKGLSSPRAGAGRTASSVVNHHPTVKPTELMRYLVRMVTPPGGLVLDPFTGSGSTGRAAMLEGMRFVGTELSPEYAELAAGRIRYTLGPLFAHLVEVE